MFVQSSSVQLCLGFRTTPFVHSTFPEQIIAILLRHALHKKLASVFFFLLWLFLAQLLRIGEVSSAFGNESRNASTSLSNWTSFLQTVSHSLMALPNEIFFWWHVITGSEEKLQGKLLVVTHVQKLISQCGTWDALKLSGNLREKLCKITAILVLNSFKRHSHSNRHDINWMIRARATHDSVDAVALTGLEQTNKETVRHHKFKRS